jgi:hypothetical protein
VQEWAVRELAFFSDATCRAAIPSRKESSGAWQRISLSEPHTPTEAAFDHDFDTMWKAPCVPEIGGCLSDHAWIGIDMTKTTELHLDEPYPKPEVGVAINLTVKCIRLFQHEHPSKQVKTARLQYWTGQDYFTHEPLTELGGGTWERRPAPAGTRWRLFGQGFTRGWKVEELRFFTDYDCETQIKFIDGEAWPVPIVSSYYVDHDSSPPFLEPDAHVPKLGFEANLHSWRSAETGNPEDGMSTSSWLGLDFGMLPADVRCFRLRQSGEKVSQASSAEVHVWDGVAFKPVNWPLSPVISDFGGGADVTRPMEAGMTWRVENVGYIRSGWRIYEIHLFAAKDCSAERLRVDRVYGSGANLFEGERSTGGPPGAASDDDESTYWQSNDDARRGTAWIAFELNRANQMVEVSCFRLLQSGVRVHATDSIKILRWTGDRFESMMEHFDLAGGQWNQRPAPGDTMWRIVLAGTKCIAKDPAWCKCPSTDCKLEAPKACPGATPQPYERAWGVSHLRFFTDSNCTPDKEVRGEPIASGHLAPVRAVDPPDLYGAAKAFDDDPDETGWIANCQVAIGMQRATCRPGREWVGLAFAEPVEIKCFEMKQMPQKSRECCDRAEAVEIHRWNGTGFARSEWPVRAMSSDLAAKDGSLMDGERVRGVFDHLSVCHAQDEITFRSRKQSTMCALPLSPAVTYLSDAQCNSHAQCYMLGLKGNCCPGDDFLTRCCCTFLQFEPLFADEGRQSDFRVSPNFIIYQLTEFLPWIVMLAAVGTWFHLMYRSIKTHQEVRAKRAERLRKSQEGLGRDELVRASVFERYDSRKVINEIRANLAKMEEAALARAINVFGAKKSEEPSKFARFFVANLLWKRTNRFQTSCIQILTLGTMGFFIGGSVVFVVVGIVFAEVLVAFQLVLFRFIRLSKHPFVKTKEVEVEGITVKVENLSDLDWAIERWRQHCHYKPKWLLDSNIAEFLTASVLAVWDGILWYWHVLFDILVVRVVVQSWLSKPPMNMAEVRHYLPFADLTYVVNDYMYRASLVSYEGVAFSLLTILGIPRCEGITKIVGACGMLGLTLALVRILNYDSFGLVKTAKNAAKKCRPRVQARLLQVTLFSAQATIFVLNQVMCLCFQRLLNFAFPPETEAEWVCPFREQITILIGRMSIFLVMLQGLVLLLVLSANGHLMGQAYLVEGMGQRVLDIDLSGLDPEGDAMIRFETFDILLTGQRAIAYRRIRYRLRRLACWVWEDLLGKEWWGEPVPKKEVKEVLLPGMAPEPVVFTFRILLAMLPTALGIWFDRWNVSGYLIELRAKVYAKQFGVTKPCEVCGEVHIPYDEVMAATAKQVGLTWQMVPGGIIIGKAAEYMNSPPLFYFGTRLKCIRGKPTQLEKAFYSVFKADGLYGRKFISLLIVGGALFQQYGSLWVQKISSILLYVIVLLGAFVFEAPLTEETDETVRLVSTFLFWGALFISLCKTCADRVIPSAFGVLHHYIKAQKHAEPPKRPPTSEEKFVEHPEAKWRFAQLVYGQQVAVGLILFTPTDMSLWTRVPLGTCMALLSSELNLFAFVRIESMRDAGPAVEGKKIWSFPMRAVFESICVAAHVVPVATLIFLRPDGFLRDILGVSLLIVAALVYAHHRVLNGVRLRKMLPFRETLAGRSGAMSGCFCGSVAALFWAQSGILTPYIEAGGGLSSGGSLAIQFAVAQVVSYICGQFQIEIVNNLKNDTPVLVAFLVTVLTYFGIDGVNILLPRLFGVDRIEWGHWYFVPIGLSVFVGLVVGSLMEYYNLMRILEDGPDGPKDDDPDRDTILALTNSRASDYYKPKKVGALMRQKTLNLSATSDGFATSPKEAMRLGMKLAEKGEHEIQNMILDDAGKRMVVDRVLEETAIVEHGPAARGEIDPLDVAGQPLEKRFSGDKLMLRTLANADDYTQADQARACLDRAIATRQVPPAITQRTPAWSLQRNAQEGTRLAVSIASVEESKQEARMTVPALPLEEVTKELQVSRYASWKPEDAMVSANMPEATMGGPPPEPPEVKSFKGTMDRFVEWAPIEQPKRKVDKSVKRRDPEEIAGEKALKEALDFDDLEDD